MSEISPFRENPQTDAEIRADRYANAFPHSTRTVPRNRLLELFKEIDDPTAIEVFNAWHGRDEYVSDESLRAAASRSDVSHFDPAEDPVPASHLLKIKKAYDRAVEQGLDEEAAFIRTLNLEHQQRFAHLLRKFFLGSK